MERYKEHRRLDKLEIRTCIHCGKQWYVRKSVSRSTIRHSKGQLLCDECLKTLSMEERQYLYKLHSGKYHKETRTCLNCGKTWEVLVKDNEIPSRTKYFCEDCNEILDSKAKTIILRQKVEGYHEKEKAQRRESSRRTHIHIMVAHAKARALKYGYEFDIQDSDIIIPEKCPLLNVPFILGEKGNYEFTPTIDRIDNSKGYTKDNIWIISKKANSMKNAASFEELKTFCTNILRYSLTNREQEPIEQEDKEPLG